MLAIHGQDRRVVLLGQLEDQFSGYYECLLIRQTDGLASLDGVDGGVQTSEAYHRRKHHVDRTSLHDLIEGLGTSIDLHVGHVAHQRLQLVITGLVGYHDGGGLELMGLLCQQFHLVIGCQAIDLIHVGMLLDHFESLCSYRPRRTEDGYLFLHNSKMPSGNLVLI